MDQQKKSEVNESFLSHSLLQEEKKDKRDRAWRQKDKKNFDFIKKVFSDFQSVNILCDLRTRKKILMNNANKFEEISINFFFNLIKKKA